MGKQIMRMRLLGLGVAVLALVSFATPTSAAIVTITNATFDVVPANPIDDDANLSSITAGGTTYSVLTGATSAAYADGAAPTGVVFSSSGGGLPADPIAAVTDGLNATTGTNNTGGIGLNLFFGQNVDGANLFFIDLGAPDTVTVNPIDGAGNLIGDFAFTTTSDAGGGSFADLDLYLNGNPLFVATLQGVVFNTSDFIGTGTLTGVEGIRLAGAGFDTITVGIAAVPEPSSLALLLVGGFGMVLRRRTN